MWRVVQRLPATSAAIAGVMSARIGVARGVPQYIQKGALTQITELPRYSNVSFFGRGFAAPSTIHTDSESEKEKKDDPSLHISNFSVSEEAKFILKKHGIENFFPIQAQTFNPLFAGKDLLGRSKTGTGKTLSFALPVMERLKAAGQFEDLSKQYGRTPVVLALAPTRELAKQVAKDFQMIAPGVRVSCIYGGVPYHTQESEFRNGVDVVVGTPGRIIDHIQKKQLKLQNIKVAILDEADSMLSFGFQQEVETVMSSLPSDRQTIMFSATLPHWVKKLAQNFTNDPEIVDLIGQDSVKTAQNVRHIAMGYPGFRSGREVDGTAEIVSDLSKKFVRERAIVFTQTVDECEALSRHALLYGECAALHGRMEQAKREKVLAGFRKGKYRMLIATDVAARGLDIPEVDVVIHNGVAHNTDQFIHRTGRTGRAGMSGVSILLFSKDEAGGVIDLERETGVTFEKPGTVQPSESASSRMDDVFDCVDQHAAILAGNERCVELAEKLLATHGDRALQLAVAGWMVDSTGKGMMGFAQRSLVTGEADALTLQYTPPRRVLESPPGPICRQLAQELSALLPKEAKAIEPEQIHGLLFGDKCVYVDLKGINASVVKTVLSSAAEAHPTIAVADTLPGNILQQLSRRGSRRDFGGGQQRGRFAKRFVREGSFRNSRGGGGHAGASGRNDRYGRNDRSDRSGRNDRNDRGGNRRDGGRAGGDRRGSSRGPKIARMAKSRSGGRY